MTPRLRFVIAISATIVVVCSAAVVTHWPHRAETTFVTRHPLTLVRHSNTFGATCFLEDALTGTVVRTPYPCGRAPRDLEDGDDDVLAMMGNASGGVVTFCVFDRVRGHDLACFDGWWPTYMRVTPGSVVVVDREAMFVEVMWIDRATLGRTTERASWMSGPDHVVREADPRGRVWRIGETQLELVPE